MAEKHAQPRWWLLYLTLPLAGVLFWLIRRAHPVGITLDAEMVGALLVVGGYVEVWRLANMVALLHHPLSGNDSAPIYYVVNEVPIVWPARAGSGTQAVLVTGSYEDLFSFPVYIGEALPSSPTVADREATSAGPAPQPVLNER